ncbi:MAG: hypothetical protein AAGI17_02940 [Planctomycetota bacterium]
MNVSNAAAIVLAAAVSCASGQVVVSDGQVLDFFPTDSTANPVTEFLGQPLLLGPGFSFVVEQGGEIDFRVDSAVSPTREFGFFGSTIRVLGDGFLRTRFITLEDVVIDLGRGARFDSFSAGSGATVIANGIDTSSVSQQELKVLLGARLRMNEGYLSRVSLSDESTLELNSGAGIGVLRVIGRNDLELTDGTVGGLFIDENSHVTVRGTSVGSISNRPANSPNRGLVTRTRGDVGSIDLAGDIDLDLQGGPRSGAGEVLIGAGSTAQIAGGALGRLRIEPGAAGVELAGGEFMLNGLPVTRLDEGLAEGDVFTGVLSDGTPVVLSPFFGDEIPAGSLELRVVKTLDSVLREAPFLQGLRPGDSAVVGASDVLISGFTAIGATLMIEDGVARDDAKLLDTDLFKTGGIDDDVRVLGGDVVRMTGGSFRVLRLKDVGRAEILGGSIRLLTIGPGVPVQLGGEREVAVQNIRSSSDVVVRDLGLRTVSLEDGASVELISDSTSPEVTACDTCDIVRRAVNASLSGGQRVEVFGGRGTVETAGRAIIRGGIIPALTLTGDAYGEVRGGGFEGSPISVLDNSTLELFVQDLIVDGSVVQLSIGESVTFAAPSGLPVRAVLEDGSPLQLNPEVVPGQFRDIFEPGTSLVVTRVSRADYDGNGVINVTDLFAFISDFTGPAEPEGLDIDRDGMVNISDLFAFIAEFTQAG